MIEIIRIVEHQASLSSYRATHDEEKAVQLELLIESTKPKNLYHEWHPLISTPFRYNPPHPNARFRAPFTKRNVLYGSLIEDTAFYEYAYNFMKQRVHLKSEPEPGIRTLFAVNANDSTALNLKNHQDCKKIMDKNNYLASHAFIEKNPGISFILYPSCRDPKHRDNAAILDITHLEKNLKRETSIKFFYDYQKKQLTWIDRNFKVHWKEVC